MSPENLNVPITGVHSYEEEEEEEDAMEGVVPGDNEVDEGSLIISEDCHRNFCPTKKMS